MAALPNTPDRPTHSEFGLRSPDDDLPLGLQSARKQNKAVHEVGVSSFVQKRKEMVLETSSSLQQRTDAYGQMTVVSTLLAGFAITLLVAIVPVFNSAASVWASHIALASCTLVIALNLYAMVALTLISYEVRRFMHSRDAADLLQAESALLGAQKYMKETQAFRMFAVQGILYSIPAFFSSILFYIWSQLQNIIGGNIAIALFSIGVLACAHMYFRVQYSAVKKATHFVNEAVDKVKAQRSLESEVRVLFPDDSGDQSDQTAAAEASLMSALHNISAVASPRHVATASASPPAAKAPATAWGPFPGSLPSNLTASAHALSPAAPSGGLHGLLMSASNAASPRRIGE